MLQLRQHQRSMKAAREVKIVNEMGLHARPAAELVRVAISFRSDVWLNVDGKRFSAESLIDVMRAQLGQGKTVTLEAEGNDAEQAVEKLGALISSFVD